MQISQKFLSKALFPFMLAFVFVSQLANARELKVGDKAPELKATNEDGKRISLNYGPNYTLVYFYPKADTPGCTAQACSLRDAYAELIKQDVQVYGVSTDSPSEQKKFKDKYKLPFTLISDTDEKVATAFGVPVRAGFTSRQAFLIKNNKIIWLDRSASTKEQAQDVLKQIQTK